MRARTRTAALLLVAALAASLTACVPEHVDRVVPGSALTIAQAAPVTSLNPAVRGQDTAADDGLAALTTSGFWRQEPGGERVAQDRFGRVRVDSEDPLTITYTVNPDVRWSDGTAVDAADLLLGWAAGTTHRTGGGPDAEGLPTTRWDTGAGPDRELDLVSEVPRIGSDGRSITLVYDAPVADAERIFDIPAVPAHGVTMRGHPGETDDPDAAKDAFVAAVQDGDLDWLAPVARAFREDYAVDDALPAAARITNGAYLVEDVADDGSTVDLRANPDYAWGPSPVAARLTLTTIPDAAERVRAVVEGEADLTTAPATPELLAAATDAAGHAVVTGSAFDHIDLQTGGGGAFDPAAYGGDVATALAVREAFLATVPRGDLLAELVAPVVPDARLRASAVAAPTPRVEDADDAAPGDGERGETDAAAPGWGETPDIARATRLLADVKVPHPVVRVLYPAGDERRAEAFGLIAQSAAEAGITVVDASRPDWATARTDEPTQYDAALFAWEADPAAPTAVAAGFHTAAAQNAYGWSDERIDALIALIGAARDDTAREALLAELDVAVASQAWSLPLFDVPVMTVWSDAVDDVPAAIRTGDATRGFATWSPTGVAGTRSPEPRNSVSPRG